MWYPRLQAFITSLLKDESGANAVTRRLEPERLLGGYTKEATVFDDGRVEVRLSTTNSAGVSCEG